MVELNKMPKSGVARPAGGLFWIGVVQSTPEEDRRGAVERYANDKRCRKFRHIRHDRT